MDIIQLTVPEEMSAESTAMLQDFFQTVLDKFVAAEAKHGWNDAWLVADKTRIQLDLIKHVLKGDPRDVAIYCAICVHFGWPTTIRST